jgi:MmyB-like transcription regulator ligand binding domain/Starch synthase catalytic domain
MLRAQVAAEPGHPRAVELVGELAVGNDELATLWARHDVQETTRVRMRVNHPLVGQLNLDWDAYPMPGDSGQVLIVYTAPEGSPDHASTCSGHCSTRPPRPRCPAGNPDTARRGGMASTTEPPRTGSTVIYPPKINSSALLGGLGAAHHTGRSLGPRGRAHLPYGSTFFLIGVTAAAVAGVFPPPGARHGTWPQQWAGSMGTGARRASLDDPPPEEGTACFVVMIASECAPVAQAGGLGEVVYGLSRELELRGHAVDVVIPKYDCMRYDQICGLTVAYEGLRVPWHSGYDIWNPETDRLLPANYSPEDIVGKYASKHLLREWLWLRQDYSWARPGEDYVRIYDYIRHR